MPVPSSVGSLCSFALVAAVAAGCASQPDKIAAQSVSTLTYEAYDCDQVGAEMDRVGRRAGTLYTSLKKTASNDQAQMAIGMLLFWPALFFLEGGDGVEAAEYGRLQGEFEALGATAVSKRCQFEPPKQIGDYLPVKPGEVVRDAVPGVAEGEKGRVYDPARPCAERTPEEQLMAPNRFCG